MRGVYGFNRLYTGKAMTEQEYIEKWLNDTLSNEERLAFESMPVYRSLSKLSGSLQDFKAPEFDVNAEFDRLKTNRQSKKESKVLSLSCLRPAMKIAASILLITAAYLYFIYKPATVVSTLASQTKEVALPDSSGVTLNALSQLSYQSKDWHQNRRVTLHGEAFFRVAKGSRFDVQTSSGVISVLGTQFNVKVRDQYFEVICYEGLVQVTSSLKTVKLAPGKVIRIVKGEVAAHSETAESAPSWLPDESAFESVPLEMVLQEFERQYQVKFKLQKVDKNQLFTGRFVHSDILLALKSISIPLDLEYKLDEDKKTVSLSGKD